VDKLGVVACVSSFQPHEVTVKRTPPPAPFFDSRRLLPPLLPAAYPLRPEIKARVNNIAFEDDDDPADVLADLLLLVADELEGPVMDERELDLSAEPLPADAPAADPTSGGAP
jgi:hypothetical protein